MTKLKKPDAKPRLRPYDDNPCEAENCEKITCTTEYIDGKGASKVQVQHLCQMHHEAMMQARRDAFYKRGYDYKTLPRALRFTYYVAPKKRDEVLELFKREKEEKKIATAQRVTAKKLAKDEREASRFEAAHRRAVIKQAKNDPEFKAMERNMLRNCAKRKKELMGETVTIFEQPKQQTPDRDKVPVTFTRAEADRLRTILDIEYTRTHTVAEQDEIDAMDDKLREALSKAAAL